MSDDANRKPDDPKTELEDRLVKRSMEPYEKVLDKDEKEGVGIFMDLFVKTHPVMRRMVDRRVREDAAIKAAKRAAGAPAGPVAPAQAESGVEGRSVEASGIVRKEQEEAGEGRGVEASGIVPKDADRPAKDKAGGEP